MTACLLSRSRLRDTYGVACTQGASLGPDRAPWRALSAFQSRGESAPSAGSLSAEPQPSRTMKTHTKKYMYTYRAQVFACCVQCVNNSRLAWSSGHLTPQAWSHGHLATSFAVKSFTINKGNTCVTSIQVLLYYCCAFLSLPYAHHLEPAGSDMGRSPAFRPRPFGDPVRAPVTASSNTVRRLEYYKSPTISCLARNILPPHTPPRPVTADDNSVRWGSTLDFFWYSGTYSVTMYWYVLLRGTILNRTYGTHKNLYLVYFAIFTTR